MAKQADAISLMVDDIFADKAKIDLVMWMKIIDRMYEDHDVAELRRKIIAKNKAKVAMEFELAKNENSKNKSRLAAKENNSSGIGSN